MTTKIPPAVEVETWDIEAMLHYGREGLRDFSHDQDELINRRNVMITSKLGDQGPVLREVVMLSLAVKDMKSVRKVTSWLEDAGDPAMGYYVYKALEENGKTEEAEGFLRSAADHGHLPALRILSHRSTKARGLRAVFWFPIARISHAWKVYKVARQNPKDLRLK